jgi:hypothetical protein
MGTSQDPNVSANCGFTVHAVFWWSWDGTAWVTQSVVSYWEKPSLTQRQRRLFYRLPTAIRAVTEPIGAGMSVDRINTIEWNGNELSGWIMINGAPTKASADRDTYLAEQGATDHQLMVWFGWSSISQAQVYTKAANRKRMAQSAARLISGTGIGSPSDPVSQNAEQAIEITRNGK